MPTADPRALTSALPSSPHPLPLTDLCHRTPLGEFDIPLTALAPGYGTGRAELADVVADELVRRSAAVNEALPLRAVHALGISPLTSDQMVVDAHGTLHLVSTRVPNEDALGEELHTACDQRLWSDFEAPLMAGNPSSTKSVGAPAAGHTPRSTRPGRNGGAMPSSRRPLPTACGMPWPLACARNYKRSSLTPARRRHRRAGARRRAL